MTITSQTFNAPLHLPPNVRTKSGATFDPREDEWEYLDQNHKVHVNFNLAPSSSLQFRFALKKIMIAYAREMAPTTVSATWGRLLAFLRVVASWQNSPINELNEVDMLNFKAHRGTPKYSGENILSQLKGCFLWWYRLALPGLTHEAVKFLETSRFKSPRKGEAVLTRDPINGPLTNIEHLGLIQAVDNAYASGTLSETSYLQSWLFFALGLRAFQMAGLKVCDITLTEDAEGLPAYSLSVPRAKQRDSLFREQMTARVLIADIGAPLYEHAKKVCTRFEGLLADPTRAPLFPVTTLDFDSKDDFRFHQTRTQLTNQLTKAWSNLDVRSERTGEQLRVSSRRLRYTFGTLAAQEQCSIEEIAELLDHSDTQSAAIYVAATPEIAIRINERVTNDLAPLAQAFRGRVIRDESEATRKNDISSRIIDMRIDFHQPMGSCGSCSKCAFVKPIACYTCSSFEPWLDGPHEKMLQRLMSERDKVLSRTDARIASINDRTILAVQYVTIVCQKERVRRGIENG